MKPDQRGRDISEDEKYQLECQNISLNLSLTLRLFRVLILGKLLNFMEPSYSSIDTPLSLTILDEVFFSLTS